MFACVLGWRWVNFLFYVQVGEPTQLTKGST